MKLEKWEDSVDELFDNINRAKTDTQIKMAKTMLRIVTRLADCEEQRREDAKEQLKDELNEITSELWHGYCNGKA